MVSLHLLHHIFRIFFKITLRHIISVSIFSVINQNFANIIGVTNCAPNHSASLKPSFDWCQEFRVRLYSIYPLYSLDSLVRYVYTLLTVKQTMFKQRNVELQVHNYVYIEALFSCLPYLCSTIGLLGRLVLVLVLSDPYP